MKKVIRITSWVLLSICIIVLLGFVKNQHDKMPCNKVDIVIEENDDANFINRNDILQTAYDKGDSLIGQPLKSIDIKGLEMTYLQNPSIEKAQVSESIDGEIKIYVKQRTPVLRIINYKNDSYYIDIEGNLMPLSESYTARVLVATGFIIESYANTYSLDLLSRDINDTLLTKFIIDDLYLLAKYINESEFWKAQIAQIYINADREIELIPVFGNHRILLGDATNLRDKFNKLLVFYIEGLNKTGWNVYTKINLKYKNQVVCTKAQQ